MGTNSGVYKFLLVLHLLAAIVGFGPTVLAAVFGAKAEARGGREGQAIAETTYDVMHDVAEWVIYAVPIFGILLVLTSDDAWKFSDAWISFSLLLYIAALAIVHALHFPNIKRMNQLMAELNAGSGPPGSGGGPPPQVAELEQRGKKAAGLGMLLNVMLVTIVVLMVWKPA